MRFLVTLELGEDGWTTAECPALPGCLSQGRTREEALANIREAIELSLETRRSLGIESKLATEIVEIDLPVLT